MYIANAIPIIPIIDNAGSMRKIEGKESKKVLLTLDNCHEIPDTHSSSSPFKVAYIGQIAGIRNNGTSHNPTSRRLPVDLYTKIATSGTIATIGAFVNIANPKSAPEIKIRKLLH